MVEVTRLELATSRSLTVRATNLRYTSIDIIVPHLFEKIKRIVADFLFSMILEDFLYFVSTKKSFFA